MTDLYLGSIPATIDVQIDPEIGSIDDADNAVTSLDLGFPIATPAGRGNTTLLEERIAQAVGQADFSNESDIISLVKSFGEINSPLGQAQVTGAATFDTGKELSAVAGQATLARGQVLADRGGLTGRDFSIIPSFPFIEVEQVFRPLTIDPTVENGVLTELDLDFAFSSEFLSRDSKDLLEGAIADVVANNFDTDRESDVISLVKAFTEESAGSSEEVVGLE
ncbi:hypothetical protein FRE64_08065 [Euhalothece natronophila Z-M001]|uniref:Uncharacterized protein n=1 Tax=Euhalothece natronophila Z-M001 TaxID=522448 RepID=A0A5B8NNY1_9CHRO|nr:hypothetical protein [Euhalothece natronophila]QDZ39900.1 hypothetical protein FRE64_08065 [Euhalothece natronophila Z-M001]